MHGRERRAAKQQRAEDEDRLASEPVGERAEREGAEHEAEFRSREHGPELRGAEFQVGGDQRGGEPHRLDVRAVHQRDQEADGKDEQLESAERARVDDVIDQYGFHRNLLEGRMLRRYGAKL